jgi:hypothetical protein
MRNGEFHFTRSHCRFHEANRKPIGVDLRQRDDRRRERHRAIWPGVLEVDSRGPRAGMAPIVAIEERSRPGTVRRKSVRVIWTVPRVGRSHDHNDVIPTTLHHCMQIKSSILVWSFICTLDEGRACGEMPDHIGEQHFRPPASAGPTSSLVVHSPLTRRTRAVQCKSHSILSERITTIHPGRPDRQSVVEFFWIPQAIWGHFR